jgi:hypothetical protein
MTEKLTPYQKRRQKENKMRHFFTCTCNSGGLQQVLAQHGLQLYSDGTVRDRGCSKVLLKHYLENVVLPDIEKQLGITGIKIHKNPSILTQNLFEWYKAEIKQEQNN